MINVNELRIGNVVEDGTVWDIGHSSVTLKCAEGKIVVDEEDLQPVALTPAVLERCGFEKQDMADLGIFTYLNISDEISLNFDEVIWVGQHKTNITTLHGLANLIFALTGTELKINLTCAPSISS